MRASDPSCQSGGRQAAALCGGPPHPSLGPGGQYPLDLVVGHAGEVGVRQPRDRHQIHEIISVGHRVGGGGQRAGADIDVATEQTASLALRRLQQNWIALEGIHQHLGIVSLVPKADRQLAGSAFRHGDCGAMPPRLGEQGEREGIGGGLVHRLGADGAHEDGGGADKATGKRRMGTYKLVD